MMPDSALLPPEVEKVNSGICSWRLWVQVPHVFALFHHDAVD